MKNTTIRTTLTSQVGYVLSKYPKTRNNDELLINTVSQLYGVNAVKKASSIERVRRLYNEKGDYLATSKKIREKRMGFSMNWAEIFNNNNTYNVR